jgi:CheY-like chemotaxis protein
VAKKIIKKPTAVVCDDDHMSRQIARAILEKVGYEVISGVGTAIEALQVVLEFQPDVLLLDLSLPGMSGEEVLPSIRTSAPETTVIVFSSYDPTTAVKNGAALIVPKGQPKQLEAMLVRVSERLRAAS